MNSLVLGLVLFLGMHSVAIVAPGLRDALATRLGAGWRVLYSLVSFAGLWLVGSGFVAARMAGPVLWTPPSALHMLTALLMLPVFPALLAAYLPGRVQTTLKHPMLVAVKAWALAHLLSNGSLAAVLLFGGFLAWAVLDRISLKRRPAKVVPGLPAGPFNDVIVLVGGLALYVAMLLWWHVRLIGVAPLAL